MSVLKTKDKEWLIFPAPARRSRAERVWYLLHVAAIQIHGKNLQRAGRDKVPITLSLRSSSLITRCSLPQCSMLDDGQRGMPALLGALFFQTRFEACLAAA